MKKIWIFLLAGTVFAACEQSGTGSFASKELVTKKDSASYAFGVEIAKQIKSSSADVDTDIMLQGMAGYLNEDSLIISSEMSGSVYNAYLAHKFEVDNKDKKDEGAAYLAENAKKEGVSITESGLQYEVLQEGSGKTPTINDYCVVHYTGTLIDGTTFDSSVDRGEPATFPASGVIRGWTEALQLMQEGGKLKVTIPYDLAYGSQGAGGRIPPFATLIFEMELLEVLNKEEYQAREAARAAQGGLSGGHSKDDGHGH